MREEIAMEWGRPWPKMDVGGSACVRHTDGRSVVSLGSRKVKSDCEVGGQLKGALLLLTSYPTNVLTAIGHSFGDSFRW